ncbi:alpha/beta-hydrolase [Xylariales sp. PMI_506]|nr:alpha/beta-hydrolase [Xylariales sp. PMI_506]
MPETTVVIVPGAWQTPAAWTDFCKTLNDAGYPTEYVALPTVGGTELPLAGLSDDVAAVQAVLEKLSDEGKNIVIIGHSSGGLVGSNAIEGYNIHGMIYLAAFMVPKGKALLDLLGGNPLPWMNVEGDRVTAAAELLPQIAFNDLEADAQAKWAKEMTHNSAALFAAPTGFEPWTNGVRCAYIFTEDDGALPYPIQQQMAAQLGPRPNAVTLKSGHCPYLSMPTQLLQAIQTVEGRWD